MKLTNMFLRLFRAQREFRLALLSGQLITLILIYFLIYRKNLFYIKSNKNSRFSRFHGNSKKSRSQRFITNEYSPLQTRDVISYSADHLGGSLLLS